MSAQQFFSEVEAVVGILGDWVNEHDPEDVDSDVNTVTTTEERFTALWQAIELLARAHSVLTAMANFEMSKQALNVPDVRREAPKQPKAARLYDGQGRPIA